MKWSDLHGDIIEVALKIQSIKKKLDADKAQEKPIILDRREYTDLFWILLRTEVKKKYAKQRISLTGQLHEYISFHRDYYDNVDSVFNIARIVRPTPPLNINNIKIIKTIDELDRLFIKSIPLNSNDLKFIHGRLIYSVMRYGGILRKDFLDSFNNVLENSGFRFYEASLWCELSDIAQVKYIWTPDRISVQLINNFYSNVISTKLPNPFSSLKFFFKKLGFGNLSSIPFTTLIKALEGRLSLLIKPMLLPIIAGNQINLTLKESAFLRLISRKSPHLEETNSTESEQDFETLAIDLIKKHPNKKAYNERQVFNYNKTKNTLKELKSLFKSVIDEELPKREKGKIVSDRLIQFLNNSAHLPLVVKYIIHWASTRSISKSLWSEILRPVTLLDYIQTIAIPMLLIFKDEDLVEMSVSELEERYSLIIDDGKDIRKQAKLARILRDFHIHLECYYCVSPIYIFQRYINKDIRNASSLVDANILMPWEYTRALRFFSESSSLQSGLSDNHSKAIQVLLILCFRCGLRRSEAKFIRLQDIEIPQSKSKVIIPLSSTLFITPHEQRYLKSNAAERKIPIGYLLTETERELFANFLEFRKQLETVESDFLFYLGSESEHGASNRAILSDEQLFDPLNLLLQRITGDKEFRIHHLRHSFATWTFWSLVSSNYLRLPFQSLCNLTEFKHIELLKKELFNLSKNQPTRKYLHFISEVIGHASPSMTLTHYIHSASWLTWCEFDCLLPTLTRDMESKLAAITDRSATRARNIPDVGYAHTGMSTYATQQLIKRSYKSDLSQWKIVDKFMPSALDLKIHANFIEVDLYRALIAHFNHGHPPLKCAQDANITVELFENACRNVEFFFDQKFSAIELEESIPRNHIVMLYEKDEQIKTPPLKQLRNLPHSKNSFSIACKMLKVFNMLDSAQKNELLWACHYIVTRCSSNWSQFKFCFPDEFRRFMNAFQVFDSELNIRKRARFALFHSNKRDKIFERYLSNQILNDYSLNLRSFKLGWTPGIDIEVDFIGRQGKAHLRENKRKWRQSHPRTNRKLATTGTPQIRRRMTEYGFRFGMYLIFFTHFRLTDEQSAVYQ